MATPSPPPETPPGSATRPRRTPAPRRTSCLCSGDRIPSKAGELVEFNISGDPQDHVATERASSTLLQPGAIQVVGVPLLLGGSASAARVEVDHPRREVAGIELAVLVLVSDQVAGVVRHGPRGKVARIGDAIAVDVRQAGGAGA